MTRYRFSEFYEFKQMLGCGGFGFVVSCTDLETGEDIALKVIQTNLKIVKTDLSNSANELLRHEKDLLYSFDCP